MKKLTPNGKMIKSIANVIETNCNIEIHKIFDNTSKATRRKHVKFCFMPRFVKQLLNDAALRETTLQAIKNEIAANVLRQNDFEIKYSERLKIVVTGQLYFYSSGVIVKFANQNV